MTDIPRLTKFFRNEDGAVTVDWVVLTAAVVGLGVSAITTTGGGIDVVTSSIAAGVASQTVD